jgi:hypothetical protein
MIASFDIGKKNFAFCIEEMDIKVLTQIQNIHKSKRYTINGVSTPEFQTVIQHVCLEGNLKIIKHVDLTSIHSNVYIAMNKVLDTFKYIFDQCTHIIIEQQRVKNTMAIKLAQHCYSYFTFHYSLFKYIVDFPSYHKTKILGAEKGMSKYQRKTWAIQKATEILLDRGDVDALHILTKHKKKDDISDVIVQLQAFKYLTFVEMQFNKADTH